MVVIQGTSDTLMISTKTGCGRVVVKKKILSQWSNFLFLAGRGMDIRRDCVYRGVARCAFALVDCFRVHVEIITSQLHADGAVAHSRHAVDESTERGAAYRTIDLLTFAE